MPDEHHIFHPCLEGSPGFGPKSPPGHVPKANFWRGCVGNMMRDTPRVFVGKGAVMSPNVCHCSVLGRAESREEEEDDMVDAVVASTSSSSSGLSKRRHGIKLEQTALDRLLHSQPENRIKINQLNKTTVPTQPILHMRNCNCCIKGTLCNVLSNLLPQINFIHK